MQILYKCVILPQVHKSYTVNLSSTLKHFYYVCMFISIGVKYLNIEYLL